MEEIKAILKLFKSYVTNTNETDFDNVLNTKKGVVIEGKPSSDVENCILSLYGKNGEELNQTLHKSFKTISESTIYELLSSQLIHYFSTYGLEQLGIKEDGFIYIPHEKLDIPELKDDIKMVLIHRITTEQLQEKIMNLLSSNIALYLAFKVINTIEIVSSSLRILNSGALSATPWSCP